MSSILKFVTILLVLNLANNAQATTGHCPKNSICTCSFLPAMKNFNIINYLGTWYEIRRKQKVGEEKCVSFSSISNLEKSDDGTIDSIVTELVKVNGTWTSVTIPNKAKQVGDNVGRFVRTFPEAYKSEDGEYLVLDTDYNSYSVVARCVDGEAQSDTVLAWIYTRSPDDGESVSEKASEAAEKFGLKLDHFHTISHKDCPPLLATQN